MLSLLAACSGPPMIDVGDSAPAFGLDARPENPSCFAPDRPATGADVALEPAWTHLSFDQPVQMLQAPGDDDRWYVVEQAGRVQVWEGDGEATIYLDITDRVDSTWSESGLLGMAFHGDDDGEIFLSYTTTGSPLVSRISRFTAWDADSADPDSEEILLTLSQPYWNHDGGSLLWGPDDLLYIGFGDGGSAGDPGDRGQDTDSLLGKVLRIDPDGGTPYAIPADNPFADGGGAPEIFAWGLRNPWRMSFDRATGQLWAGDVGQDDIEEIDLVELGGNYGWNEKEGTECYDADDPCEGGGWIDPVAEYDHRQGESVTGGYVYRGSAIPSLAGTYLYADYVSGYVWALFYDEEGQADPQIIVESGIAIPAFAEGNDGEIYVLDYVEGTIRSLVADAGPSPSQFPELLSETGCLDAADPSLPGDGLIPYAPISPLWSDGAEKERWFAIPDGTTIDVDESGDFLFPVGSVLVKAFRLDGALVETRLFVRHEDGEWGGYTYAWNGDDATLATGGDMLQNGWGLPTGAECMQCHSAAAGRSLGLEVAQLDTSFDYDGTSASQLATLEHIGVFSASLPAIDPLPSPTDTSWTTEERARSYLHANCANCHRPEGTGRGEIDLRYTTDFADMGLCDAEPQEGDLGVTDARLLVPGDPSRSILSLRPKALDANRMPPVASTVVDEEGVALLDAWIEGIQGCE